MKFDLLKKIMGTPKPSTAPAELVIPDPLEEKFRVLESQIRTGQEKLGESMAANKEKELRAKAERERQEKLSESMAADTEEMILMEQEERGEDMSDAIEEKLLFAKSHIFISDYNYGTTGGIDTKDIYRVGGTITGVIDGVPVRMTRTGFGGHENTDQFDAVVNGREATMEQAKELWFRYVKIACMRTLDVERTTGLSQDDRDIKKLLP